MFAGIAALVAAAISAATQIGGSISEANKARKAKLDAKLEAERQARHDKRMRAIEMLGGDSGGLQIDYNKDKALKGIDKIDTSINWAPIANSLGGVANAVGGLADRMPSSAPQSIIPSSATQIPYTLTDQGSDSTFGRESTNKTLDWQNPLNAQMGNLGDWKLGDQGNNPFSLTRPYNSSFSWRY